MDVWWASIQSQRATDAATTKKDASVQQLGFEIEHSAFIYNNNNKKHLK